MSKLDKIRDKKCTLCRLSNGAVDVCVMGHGLGKADIMVVGKMPNSNQYQQMLEGDLADAGLDPNRIFFTSVVKCRNFDVEAGTKTSIKACSVYLDAEIALVKPKWILTLGNEALQAVGGHSGVMKYRGKLIDRGGYSVFPTISPASVSRNPGQRGGYIADLRLFAAEVFGKEAALPPPTINYVLDKGGLKQLMQQLKVADVVSYDVETYSDPPGSEWVSSSQIISLSMTLVTNFGPGTQSLEVWAVPLCHPGSPFRRIWQRVLELLAPLLVNIPKRIAHNGKYDDRWLRQFGVGILQTFDTMLAAHLIDENVSKGLKQQGAMRLGVKPWAIDTKDLRTTPIMEVLEYNALDTFYTYHIYLELKAELAQELRLARLFKFVMMPANQILTDVERRGIWVDRERLATNGKIAYETRADIDRQLMEYVPKLEKTKDWPRMGKGQGKHAEVNFNASIFARWFLFEHLGFPVIARGKEKDDGTPGDPSMAEDVMLHLRMYHPHPVVDLMLERARWQKICSAFIDSYQELLDENDRIHTTFKLYGTVTGRLSSGKAEADKITARAPVRGVNLQQVPRDPFIRGLFGAAPGYTFVEADFSQVELRVVAFISRDRTMMHLYQTGQDIHTATASWVLGVPISQVSKDDRKKAKAVNFGFVYGMYPKKFVATAFEKYDLVFTLDEATAIRQSFFEQFRGLLPWHNRQRRLVNQYRRVQSPLGRIRHLPDIDSPEKGVRMEAERQAINSPVQSFASDMTMLAMVEIDRKTKKRKLDANVVLTVHDALGFEIRNDHVADALPIIKSTMENLPLERKFGVVLDVPIKVDFKVGTNWGDAKELTEQEVYEYNPDAI